MNLSFSFPLLLDGGAVSNLEQCGMPPGTCAEEWSILHPEVLSRLQREWLDAGAQVLCAPTYGANTAVLSEFGLEADTARLNRVLMERTKATAADRVPAGGRVGPSGLFVPPFGSADFDEIYTVYRQQIRALHEGGADFLLLEDQCSLADMRAALLAARTTELPVFVALSIDASGHTLTGGSLLPALVTLQAMGADAVGLSCGPLPFMEKPLQEAAPYASVPLIARPDASPSPDDFASSLYALAQTGIAIVGGCCGTTPEHISALSHLLRRSPPIVPPAKDPSQQEDGFFSAATEKESFFLGEDICLSRPVFCSSSLEEDLIALENEPNNTALVYVETLNDARILADLGASSRLPIAVHCDSAPVLDAALRYFQGRLLIDSNCQLEEAELHPLSVKYGAVLY